MLGDVNTIKHTLDFKCKTLTLFTAIYFATHNDWQSMIGYCIKNHLKVKVLLSHSMHEWKYKCLRM